MKLSILSFFVLSLFVFSSCQKGDGIKDDKWKETKDWDGKDKDGDEKGSKCFELVYPVTYNMPDGSTATGDNEEEVWTAIKAWFKDHPDSAGKPSLQYPVEVLWEDGTNETIADEEAMILAKKDCDDDKDGPHCGMILQGDVTLRNNLFDVPASGSRTVTGSAPDAPTRIEGTDMTIWLATTLVGVRTAVPSSTELFAVKFAPDMVKLNVLLPAETVPGEIDVICGTRFVCAVSPIVNVSV